MVRFENSVNLFSTPKRRYTWLAAIWFGMPVFMAVVSFYVIHSGEGSFLLWLIILMTPSVSLRFGIIYGLIALAISALIVRHGIKQVRI